jgi:benzoate membrane transport protein
MIHNLRDLPGALSLPAITAALVAVLVGYSGPMLIVIQAAENAGLDRAHLSSWIWAITVGSGASAILLSLWHRQPILVAWPAAGIALLVSSLPQYAYAEAIGAYIIAALALVALGVSGLFSRVINQVPTAIIAGMLAGMLLRFGLGVFRALGDAPLLVGVMVLVFLLLRRVGVRAPSIGTLAVGLLVAAALGQLSLAPFIPQLTAPLLTWPHFSVRAILGLSLPLFVLANVSQNAPGLAVLRSFGYQTNPDGPITLTGLISLLTAPFGSSGLALAAITAAIVVSPEAQPDPNKRYAAGAAYGCWYILFGLFGAAAVTLFTGLPGALVAALAGLALTGAMTTALGNAMAEPARREAALLAFLVTAADVPLAGIGAPFWGLVIGVAADYMLHIKKGELPRNEAERHA